MALMTQKAYAAKRGVTPQYINKLVNASVIKLVRGKVDPRQANAAIAANRTRLERRGKTPPKQHRATSRAKKTGRPARDPNNPNGKPDSSTRTLASAKAEREHYLALQAKLEWEKTIGKLLSADVVLDLLQKHFANLRARLRRLPRQQAPIVKRFTSIAEIEQFLLQDADSLLEEFASDPLGVLNLKAPPVPAELMQASAVALATEATTTTEISQ